MTTDKTAYTIVFNSNSYSEFLCNDIRKTLHLMTYNISTLLNWSLWQWHWSVTLTNKPYNNWP